MNQNNNGVPAFPSPGVVMPSGVQQGAYEGMTLRDYFAAKAMAAILTCNIPVLTGENKDQTVAQYVAQKSYAMADAMMEARNVRRT